MSTSPTVSVLVVSYNTREMTLECIRSVFAETTETSFELIVVDNASTDGSAETIEREFDGRIRFIRSDENLGFARANNAAAAHAKGEFLLLLNPDTLVRDAAIDQIVAFARKRPEAGVWGGRTLYGDESLNPTSCWGFMSLRSMVFQMLGLTAALSWSEFFSPETYGRWQRDCERHVDIVTGCFLLITRDFWNTLGGFNPRYFMYAEEADLCKRAQYLGAKPMITPAATIVHFESQSDPIRLEKTIKVLCAKVTFIRLHWSGAKRIIGLALIQFSPMLRSLIYRAIFVLTRMQLAKKKACLWGKIYQRRLEWVEGYPPYDCPDRSLEATR